jgi:hypothetical protein
MHLPQSQDLGSCTNKKRVEYFFCIGMPEDYGINPTSAIRQQQQHIFSVGAIVHFCFK